MSSTIPNGAMLVFTQHCVDLALSRTSYYPTIHVEGKTANQDEHLIFDARTDGTTEITDSWCGRPLNVHVDAKDNNWHFKSVAGKNGVDVDLQLVKKGDDVDVQGTIDQRSIEYHRVVGNAKTHTFGINEHGHIGDVPFNDNRWAQPGAVQIKGTLGDKTILQEIEFDKKPHPYIFRKEYWTGQCGDTGVDETVTRFAELTP